MKDYINIGIAVDTPGGLMVPVLKNVDQKSFIDLAIELSGLSTQAREGSLKVNQMQGGTMTISSLGGIGGVAFTPIINAPEVCILGISKGYIKPVWDGQQFIPVTRYRCHYRMITGLLMGRKQQGSVSSCKGH